MLRIDPDGSQMHSNTTAIIRFIPEVFLHKSGSRSVAPPHIEKDCRFVAFPASLGMTQYAFHTGASCQYQVVAVISYLGAPDEDRSRHIPFLMVFGQGIRFDVVTFKLSRNRPYDKRTSGNRGFHSNYRHPALSGRQLNKYFSKQFVNQILFLSSSINRQ
jgi:hypothetical protein